MAFNDIYRLRIHQRLHGQEVLNILHFVQDNPDPLLDAGDLASDFFTNMGTTLRGRATNALFFEYVEVVPLVPYGGGPEVVSWAANTTGTVAGTTYSGTLAEVVTLYTSEIGRRHRGRIYLTGSIQSAISAGVWSAGQTTATQALATALTNRYVTSSAGAGWKLGVWSRVIAGPDPPWSTDAFTRVTSLTVRTLVRNQRRRQIGVGR